jgi:hypothetical protein
VSAPPSVDDLPHWTVRSLTKTRVDSVDLTHLDEAVGVHILEELTTHGVPPSSAPEAMQDPGRRNSPSVVRALHRRPVVERHE